MQFLMRKSENCKIKHCIIGFLPFMCIEHIKINVSCVINIYSSLITEYKDMVDNVWMQRHRTLRQKFGEGGIVWWRNKWLNENNIHVCERILKQSLSVPLNVYEDSQKKERKERDTKMFQFFIASSSRFKATILSSDSLYL